MYDEEMTESHLMQVQDDSDLGVNIDESVCSHFCHISSHMVGLIDQTPQVPIVVASSTHFTSNKFFQTLTLSPPIQPPKS